MITDNSKNEVLDVSEVKNNNKEEKRLITARNDRIFKTIFIDKNDYHLMESILSECLEE